MERQLFISKTNNDLYRGECGMVWKKHSCSTGVSTISFEQMPDLDINAENAVQVDFDKELEDAKANLRKNHRNIIAW